MTRVRHRVQRTPLLARLFHVCRERSSLQCAPSVSQSRRTLQTRRRRRRQQECISRRHCRQMQRSVQLKRAVRNRGRSCKHAHAIHNFVFEIFCVIGRRGLLNRHHASTRRSKHTTDTPSNPHQQRCNNSDRNADECQLRIGARIRRAAVALRAAAEPRRASWQRRRRLRRRFRKKTRSV